MPRRGRAFRFCHNGLKRGWTVWAASTPLYSYLSVCVESPGYCSSIHRDPGGLTTVSCLFFKTAIGAIGTEGLKICRCWKYVLGSLVIEEVALGE